MDEFVMDLLSFVNQHLCESGEKFREYDLGIEKALSDDDLKDYYRSEGENGLCQEFLDFIIQRYSLLSNNQSKV